MLVAFVLAFESFIVDDLAQETLDLFARILREDFARELAEFGAYDLLDDDGMNRLRELSAHFAHALRDVLEFARERIAPLHVELVLGVRDLLLRVDPHRVACHQ